MEQKSSPRPRKSKGVAIALAFFFGGIGIHKFYLEKPGQGILYVVFCWTFIPLILSLFEVIIMLATSNEAWAKKWA